MLHDFISLDMWITDTVSNTEPLTLIKKHSWFDSSDT